MVEVAIASRLFVKQVAEDALFFVCLLELIEALNEFGGVLESGSQNKSLV